MIRLVQRRLIIPRGDTGSFTLPVLPNLDLNNSAIFTIFNMTHHTKLFQKIINNINGETFVVRFEHEDTVNLPAGKYFWDIKFYTNPVIVDNIVVSGTEVDSYYAAFTLPVCEIRETGDLFLTADESPTTTIAPESLNVLMAAVNQVQNSVEHYPKIIDGEWYVWDTTTSDYISTNVLPDYLTQSDIEGISIEELDEIIGDD